MERNFRPAAENLYFMGNFSIYFTLALKTITQPTMEAVIPLGLVKEGWLAWSSFFVCRASQRQSCSPSLGKNQTNQRMETGLQRSWFKRRTRWSPAEKGGGFNASLLWMMKLRHRQWKLLVRTYSGLDVVFYLHNLIERSWELSRFGVANKQTLRQRLYEHWSWETWGWGYRVKQNGKAAHEGWVMGQLLPGTMRAQSCREFWEAVEHAAGSPTGRKRELRYLSRTDISILLLSPSASLFFLIIVLVSCIIYI